MSFVDVASEEPTTTEADLTAAKDVVRGSVPLISEAPDVMVRLPRGLYNGTEWENDVEIRELTGADEEALARFKDAADFFNGVVVYGTTRIGSQDLTQLGFAERQSILAGLLIGEREQLFLHIARVTYGDTKDLEHSCPSCQADLETTLLISEDIKAPEMENPYTLTYTMTTAGGAVLTYRLATGADQMAVFSKKGASLPEQNTLMISQCVTQIDGKPVVDPMAMARNLSMGDRRRLLEHLVDDQPSPKLELSIPCVSCGFEMIVPLSWGDIFRP